MHDKPQSVNQKGMPGNASALRVNDNLEIDIQRILSAKYSDSVRDHLTFLV